MDLSFPMTINEVARASALAAILHITVTLNNELFTGKPVLGLMECDTFSPLIILNFL